MLHTPESGLLPAGPGVLRSPGEGPSARLRLAHQAGLLSQPDLQLLLHHCDICVPLPELYTTVCPAGFQGKGFV